MHNARLPVAASVVLVLFVAVGSIDPASAVGRQPAPPVVHLPPVDAPVIDPFRPPAHPYGAGNRGLEYATEPGTPVLASADGEVVFAGQVAESLHVTLRHRDGLRTSYSFLASISVRAGDRVSRGEVVGTAGASLHFGVRDTEGNYLDPALLLSGRLQVEVHLVPGVEDGGSRLDARDREVTALRDIVRDRFLGAAAFGARLVTAIDDGWSLRIRAAINATSPAHALSVGRSMQAWYLQSATCTPPEADPPARTGRRILVLVGGIGSSSDHAAVDRVDHVALGYADGDVVRFSYRGGRTPAALPAGSSLGSLESTSYGSVDSQQDLELSASRLRALLAAISTANPGVPIDVVAHSQGGVVARLAITEGSPPPEVQNLVTLGTPHHGANLATAVAAARLDPRLHANLEVARAAGNLDLDPDSPAAAQLAESSGTVASMNQRPLPRGVRVTSIGARGDLTVPAPRTIVGDGSRSTVVALGGLSAHDDLPGSAAARREIALAVSGASPTCRSLARALTDALAAESIDSAEDDIVAAVAWAPVLSG